MKFEKKTFSKVNIFFVGTFFISTYMMAVCTNSSMFSLFYWLRSRLTNKIFERDYILQLANIILPKFCILCKYVNLPD